MKALAKHPPSIVSSFRLPFLFLVLSLLFGSCQKPNYDDQQNQSALNVVNATIDMPSLGFFINKIHVQGPPLNYMDKSGYFITFPGSRDVDVAADGIPDYILKTNFNFKPNTYHTIFITGERTTIDALFTEDDLSNPPAGKAKIRFVHLSPDGGSLILTLKDGTVLFSEQSYKTASAFVPIDPGIYDLQLKTTAGAVVTEKNVTITAGGLYTAWSKGMKSGNPNFPFGLQVESLN